MPGGDGTGPWGVGPMTGRGTGYCAGYKAPCYGNSGMRAGLWCRGGGAGQGWRNRCYATGPVGWQQTGGWQRPLSGGYGSAINQEQHLEALKNQAERMQTALEDIRNEIEKMKSQNTADSK